MAAKSGFLRRASNVPGGIAAGGADTGFDIQPQKTLLTKRVSQATQDVILPKGTTVFAAVAFPDPDIPASAGTVSIDAWDLAGGASTSTLLSDADATVYTETANVTMIQTDTQNDQGPAVPYKIATGFTVTGTILAEDTRYRITPDSIPAGEAVMAGLLVILPRTRA